MTSAQTKLRALRDRQSKERGKMAEYGMADSLSDEQRSELDAIEAGTPDLERQLRGAQVAVDDEERTTKIATAAEPDAEARERDELRSRATVGGYLTAAYEAARLPVPRPNSHKLRASTEFRSSCGSRPGARRTRNARSVKRLARSESIWTC